MIFDYPESRPAGYKSYERYRPWLRDEFTFRCAYCLKRETWGQVTGEFELDHFRPQSLDPHLRLDYFNLVYACRRCNLVKLDQRVDDPIGLIIFGNGHRLARWYSRKPTRGNETAHPATGLERAKT